MKRQSPSCSQEVSSRQEAQDPFVRGKQRSLCSEAPALRQGLDWHRDEHRLGLRKALLVRCWCLWPLASVPSYGATLGQQLTAPARLWKDITSHSSWREGGLTFTLVTRDPSAFLIHAISSSVSFSERRSPAVQEE